MVKRGINTNDAGVGHQAMGWLETHDSAPRSRDADRAALISTNSEVDIVIIERGARAAGGPTSYRENTPRYGVRVSHSLRQRLNDPIIPAIAKFLQKRHDVFLARLVVAINSGS